MVVYSFLKHQACLGLKNFALIMNPLTLPVILEHNLPGYKQEQMAVGQVRTYERLNKATVTLHPVVCNLCPLLGLILAEAALITCLDAFFCMRPPTGPPRANQSSPSSSRILKMVTRAS